MKTIMKTKSTPSELTLSLRSPAAGITPITDSRYCCGRLLLLLSLCLSGFGFAPAAAAKTAPPEQTGYTLIHNFGSIPNDGSASLASLVQGSDGALYGTTQYGGSSGFGVIFKLNSDGSGYTVLHNFGSIANDGTVPNTALIQASDGALYGTTQYGGRHGAGNRDGTVFKLNLDGTGYTVLYNFGSIPNDGKIPFGAVVQASDGALYGTTREGGTYGYYGTVFKLNLDGTAYTVLHNFGSIANDGNLPLTAPIQASDGALYGTTRQGGTEGAGTIFKLNVDGTGYTVLHNFVSIANDGALPLGGLIQTSDGALYGTTFGGGTTVDGRTFGVGTVFKLNPDGTGYSVLHKFGTIPNDGYNPYAALMQASDGALYGTTFGGGTIGAGTVFKLKPDGTGYKVLYNFGSIPNDGYNLFAALIQASDGALYGTTQVGGSTGAGTVFRLTVNNNLFAGDGIVWHQPLARNGMSEDTDPSAGGTLKYRFKLGSTIPIQIHAQGHSGDVTLNANVIGKVEVFGDTDMDGVADGNALTIDYNGVGEPGGIMDKIGGHLKYTLDTKKLPQTTKCYLLQVTVTDTSTGESRSETIPLQAE